MTKQSHVQKKSAQPVASTSTPIQSRPFEHHPVETEQQTPDLQTQLQQAQQFGHSLARTPLTASTAATLPIVQAKLTIGQPNDKYEQEADQVAAEVVSRIHAPQTTAGQVQRSQTLEKTKLPMKPAIQRRSALGGTAASEHLEASINQARGGGQSLSSSIRQPMEQAFGADFSSVRVHTDSHADQLSRSIHAQAFTTKNDIFFSEGNYNPSERSGQELLAHELTHVVQQTGNTVQRQEAIVQRDTTSAPKKKAPEIIYMDESGVGHDKPAPANSAPSKIYMDESGVGHDKPAPANSPPSQIYMDESGVGHSEPKPAASALVMDDMGTIHFQQGTWDALALEGKGRFVDAMIPTEKYNTKNEMGYKSEVFAKTKDGRNFKAGSAPSTNDPNAQLQDGNISAAALTTYTETAKPEDVARLDFISSNVIRNILKFPLQQSWHVAKHELAQSKSETARSLMRKLWEFRQWHYELILRRTQKQVTEETNDPTGLTNWPSAGSTSLTSDIDVNLKGSKTEKAVEVFNRLFKKDGWDYEAGVVYDVNVYAMDFMHAFKGIKKQDEQGKEHTITGKEGKREGLAQGGFKEDAFGKRDMEDQDEWSLVKLRLYISNPIQWEEYATAAELTPEKKKSVEAKFQNYVQELQEEMKKRVEPELRLIDEEMSSGIENINQNAMAVANDNEVLAEDVKIGASNRVYEQKLKQVAALRAEIQDVIAHHDAIAKGNQISHVQGEVTNLDIAGGAIEHKLKILRKLVSECALYSNEAYVTDAAVNHAVVGLQGGNPVEQSKAELMQAVTENMGDALKEISRHSDTMGEAAFKAGKYILRMADVAKNMGLGSVDGVQKLYEAGYAIAETIKSYSSKTAEAQEHASAAKLKELFGIEKSPSQLVAIILQVGTAIRQAFSKLNKPQKQALGQASEIAVAKANKANQPKT